MLTKTHNRAMMTIVLLIGLLVSPVVRADDLADVTAANETFYAALNARDADAMSKVYAHEPYVVNIGPRSKTAITGWTTGVEDSWKNIGTAWKQLHVTTSDMRFHIVGNTAWVEGMEHVSGALKDGTPVDLMALVTNIYEKQGGRWLMVLHHAHAVS